MVRVLLPGAGPDGVPSREAAGGVEALKKLWGDSRL